MRVFQNKSIVFFSIAVLLVFIVVGGMFYVNAEREKSDYEVIAHIQDVLRAEDNVLVDAIGLEPGDLEYLFTGDETFLARSGSAVAYGNPAYRGDLADSPASAHSGRRAAVVVLRKRLFEKLYPNHTVVGGFRDLDAGGRNKAFFEREKMVADSRRQMIDAVNGEAIDWLREKNAQNAGYYRTFQGLYLLLLLFLAIIFARMLIQQQRSKNNECEAVAATLRSAYHYSLSLIEAGLDPMVAIGPSGEIIDMNEAFAKATGMTRVQLMGSDFIDYFTNPTEAGEVYRAALNMGNVVDAPLTMKCRKGSITDVLCNGSVFKDDSGKTRGVVVVARNVSAQKLAPQYARSLIEASLDPLFTISIEGKITDMNNASLNITGKTREQLKGTDFFNYFTDPDKAKAGYQQVFAEGFVSDYPLTMMDHKLTDVLFNGSVYKDAQGKVLGVVVVARDITEQKRIEKELNESIVIAEMAADLAEEAKNNAENSMRLAEGAVKSKQQFLSNMSHEIRTPMNAIIGFTKVLLKTELTVKQKEYLTAIKVSGDALIVLLNDILDLAKVDAGKMTFERVPFKMELSIQAMLHMFDTKIREKNLQLVSEYDNTIPEVLVGDPVRLRQIILNLVSNAVKFTSHGTIKVSVRLLRLDADGAMVEFAVSDTGIGIPAARLGKIFENFQQASSGTSRVYGGTGLGLAIVKQLVEPQGGSIGVVSTPDVGSTFSFMLTFGKASSDAVVEETFSEQDEDIKNIKVLVVEDIALNQLLMKTLLDDFGFERDIASNGRIAIENLQNKTYDVILMDLQMPEMNGFEATAHIRNVLKSKVPIIALTADVTTVDLEKCKAVGMNDYIAKPVDEKLLYSKIMGLVKKPSPAKETTPQDGEARKLKYIDLDYLVHRTKSNPRLMMEMISLYLEQTPTLISTMKSCLKGGDWKMLHAAAHKLIPSFAIMGISTDVENMTKKILEYARTREETEGIPEMLSQIELVCTEACKELEVEFDEIKKTIDSK